MPAHNAAATIAATLRSIAAQRPAAPWQLIVVDDGSEDGTA
ncbi:MAG TPA: glycosyltransferase family A protein, partial [Acidobacteriota bacterium]